MRWTVLYARSRQLPAAFAALIVCTTGIRLLARSDWALPHALLALTAAIAVAAIGLSGQDPDLDRAAALPWPPRRFLHLTLIGVAAAGAVLAVQQPGTTPVALSLILRDAAGLLGLAGLAATIAGGQFGWTLPVAWCAAAPFVPHGIQATHIVAWMLQPPGTTAATWTAVVLAATGMVAYTAFGARR